MDLGELKTLLGWCIVINYGVLLIWFAVVMVAGNWLYGVHARLFRIDSDDVPMQHFKLFGQFKLLVMVFNIAPWLALLILGY